MNMFNITLVRSKIKSKPYCKVDGVYAGPTWKNDIGLQAVPHDINSVYDLFIKLSQEPLICMVYGTAIKPKIFNTDRTMANFSEEPVSLLTLDLDKYEGNLKDEYPTIDDCIKNANTFIEDMLPPEFNNASYVLRFSSSFLAKSTSFKTHIVFLLAEAQYPREIGTWIKTENIPADPTFYFNLTQPVFTSAPIFINQVDPLKRMSPSLPRVYLVKKENNIVESGWQPHNLGPKNRIVTGNNPNAEDLPGQIGSFCRMMTIDKALIELGYEPKENNRYLSPTSDSKIPGAIIFENGYVYSHHSNDPIYHIAEKVYKGKRNSFNAYDLMYGNATLNQETNPELMSEFKFLLAQANISDREYQDEIIDDLIYRTEWLIEDGYAGDNKIIVDSLMHEISSHNLNEMSRTHIFNIINVKTAKKIKLSDLNRAWKQHQKDSAFYDNKYGPDAGLRMMAQIFIKKKLVYPFHYSLRGDFWCYYNPIKMWRRLNIDQTHGYIYNHLHEALPLKQEIPFNKVNELTTLILRLLCESNLKFNPGKGWAFKGGKIGILMPGLFKEKWLLNQNVRSLIREHNIHKELPITFKQWKSALTMPKLFNDFLASSCEEDYEKVELLQEFIGYIFADSYHLNKFFILEGVPGSGKSILIKILRQAINPRFFTSISLSRVGTQFGLGEISGKKLIVMSEAREINFSQLRAAVPVLLKISGNDPLDIEVKFKTSTTEVMDGKLIIITNRTPVMPDDTGALSQRIIMMRLNKTFRDTKEEILGLDDKIINEELPSVIKWALVGLERLTKRKQFYIPKTVLEESSLYRQQLDPLKMFIDEFFIYDGHNHKSKWVLGATFTTHFHEYLHRIGQTMTRAKVQKRANAAVLRSLDKRLNRKVIRNGHSTLSVIEPLIPNRDLDIEFTEEREELLDIFKQ